MNPAPGMPIEPYATLAQASLAAAKEGNDALSARYGLGNWEAWNLEQETGILTFSNAGRVGLAFKSCIAGSISSSSGTWLWSWANKSILATMSSPMLATKRFGEERGYPRLSQEKWAADENDGWEVSAVACKLLNGYGVYRAPVASGFLFVVPLGLVSYDP